MRAILLALAVLAAVTAGLVAGDLRLARVRTEPIRPVETAPDLASPHLADVPAERAAGPAAPTEHCGPTRLEVVRRVTHHGDAAAMLDILPPSRWEAWPEVVRACHAAYGPLTSPPSWDSPTVTTRPVADPPHRPA